MTYTNQQVYARYLAKDEKSLKKGKVYKLAIHERQLNWFEKFIFGVTGTISKYPAVKIARIHRHGAYPALNYESRALFNQDWKIEPNWYDQSKNRSKKKGK